MFMSGENCRDIIGSHFVNDTITENKTLKVDLAVFAVRELGPNYPYFGQGIKHSKTVTDEKVRSFSTRKDTTKHKKIPVSWAGKTKMGQKFLMGRRFLERRVVTRNSLFNRQLTGKKQAFEKFIYWIFELR